MRFEALHSVSLYGDGQAPAEFLFWMLVVIAIAIWVGVKE
jgi:hypothetical protein